MADLSRRNLRERRAPKSFDSDNEDQDPWGYSKPSYSKEPRNPSQQLNSDAKLLVKYISAINKSYREHEEERRKKQLESIKEPTPLRDRKPKTTETQLQPPKRFTQPSREGKLETTKKQKQLYNYKPQSHNDGREPPTPESFLNKYKTLNTESAQKMLNIQYGISKNKQNGQDSVRINKPEKPIGLQSGHENNNSFKKTQTPSNQRQETKVNSQNPFYNHSKEKLQKIEEAEARLNIPKPNMSPSKLFKRSTYHIAIAYHIYVIQVKQRGLDMDPTSKARKLKQGMNR